MGELGCGSCDGILGLGIDRLFALRLYYRGLRENLRLTRSIGDFSFLVIPHGVRGAVWRGAELRDGAADEERYDERVPGTSRSASCPFCGYGRSGPRRKLRAGNER